MPRLLAASRNMHEELTDLFAKYYREHLPAVPHRVDDQETLRDDMIADLTRNSVALSKALLSIGSEEGPWIGVEKGPRLGLSR